MSERLPLPLRIQTAATRPLARLVLGSPTLCSLVGRRRAARVDGRVLDPQVAALLALDDLVGDSALEARTPAEARARMLAQIAVVDAPPPPGVAVDDHWVPGPAEPIHVRVYTPPGLASPSPGVLYLHGGGCVTGSVTSHDALCRWFAVAARCHVASAGYRLAPEHRFPAAADDAVAAFRWLAGRAHELGIDPARIAVAGDSAGGNLSAVVAHRARGDARPPALQVLLYPATDLTASHRSHETFAEGYLLTRASVNWYLDHYVPEVERRRHEDASPLFAASHHGVAPALVYTAGFDPLRDEGRAYADRLQEAGVRVRYRELVGLIHGFASMAGVVDAARRAMEDVFADVRRELWG